MAAMARHWAHTLLRRSWRGAPRTLIAKIKSLRLAAPIKSIRAPKKLWPKRQPRKPTRAPRRDRRKPSGCLQFSYYKARSELWCAWKTSSKLEKLLVFLYRLFVDLFEQHRTGSEPFARFLVSWYKSLGKIACSKMSDARSRELWLQLSQGQPAGICDEDRSALVIAVGASCYTFMRKQVRNTCTCMHVHKHTHTHTCRHITYSRL